MIIAIDGPAGAGKTTVARALARALNLTHIDTGAMYRAMALKALRTETPFNEPEQLVELARATDIQLDCGPTYVRVMMDGKDVSEAIRSLRVSQHTNPIASNPGVRRILVEKQRQIGRKLGSLVSEGRDQGSVVFPDADLRVLLEASDVKRAERRCIELRADGEEVDFDAILANIRSRDGNDQAQWEPLLNDPSVVRIDTTNMSIAQVVERLRGEVERVAREPGREDSPR